MLAGLRHFCGCGRVSKESGKATVDEVVRRELGAIPFQALIIRRRLMLFKQVVCVGSSQLYI